MFGRAVLLAILIGIAISFAAYYINGREADAARVMPLTSIGQIAGLSPTQCTYEISSFGNGSNGYLFIYQDKIRVNIQELALPNFSGTMQALLGVDGTFVVDSDSVRAANGKANAEKVLDTIFSQAPWKCSPWWFPDSSAFDIPNPVTF